MRKKSVLVGLIMFSIVGTPFIALLTLPALAATPEYYVIPLNDWLMNDDIAAIKLANHLMELGVPVYQAQEDFVVNGQGCSAGDFIIPGDFGGTADGISIAAKASYFETEATKNRIWHIIKTGSNLSEVNMRRLVLPRVVIPFGRYLYINIIWHYITCQKLGIKVVLANPTEMEDGSIFNSCNVLVLPGSGSGLSSTPWVGNTIQNIRDFVAAGGGVFGTCAGGTQMSMSSWARVHVMNGIILGGHFEGDPCPPEHLNDYDYWYCGKPNGEVYWKLNTGPQMLNINRPDHPTMFGLGPTATRFGYQYPQVFYFGGDTLEDLTPDEEVVATFKASTAQDRNNPFELKYDHRFYGLYDNWGYRHGAVVVTNYSIGRCVYFGPHPECAGMYGDSANLRMYANILYWCAQNETDLDDAAQHFRYVDEPTVPELPDFIEPSAVTLITQAVDGLKIETDRAVRAASHACQLVPNDQYLGFASYAVSPHDYFEWLTHMYPLENDLKKFATKFYYEYCKLNALKAAAQGNPTLLGLINDAQAKIVTFFEMAANLKASVDPLITIDVWSVNPSTGVNYTYALTPEPSTVADFASLMEIVADELWNLMIPHHTNMSTYVERLRVAADNWEATGDPIYKEEIDNCTAVLTACYRYYGVGSSSNPHPFDILERLIGQHLFNLLMWADVTYEAILYIDSLLAHYYPLESMAADFNAFAACPAGPFT